MHQFLPRKVGLEIVRGCNFTCRMCPVPLVMPNKAFHFMALDLIEKLCAEACESDHVKEFRLFNFGEPMAHPDFVQIIDIVDSYFTGRPTYVDVLTNGSLLHGPKAEAIARSTSLTALTVSFDGDGRKEVFEALRGPHYEKVINNMRDFADLVKHTDSKIVLKVNSIIPVNAMGDSSSLYSVPDYDKAVETLSALVEPIGYKVQPRTMHDYSGEYDLGIRGDIQHKPRGACATIETDQLYISSDGIAIPCCTSMNKTLNIGDANDMTLVEIMNSPAMNNLRHTLRIDRRHEIEGCKNCKVSVGGTHISRDRTSRFWLERNKKHPITDEAEKLAIFGEIELDHIAPSPKATEDAILRASASAGGAIIGYIDAVQHRNGSLVISGWAGDTVIGAPLSAFVPIIDGKEHTISSLRIVDRPGVAEHVGNKLFLKSGFELIVAGVTKAPQTFSIRVFNPRGISQEFRQ